MNQQRRDQINRLIDIFVDWDISIAQDAGWHGNNQVGRWMEMGILPPPKHQFHESNTKSINEIQYLRREHELLGDARALMTLLRREKLAWYDAIYQKRRHTDGAIYNGPNALWQEGKPYNDEIRAHLVGQTLPQYKNNLRQAYRFLDDKLQILELRRELAA